MTPEEEALLRQAHDLWVQWHGKPTSEGAKIFTEFSMKHQAVLTPLLSPPRWEAEGRPFLQQLTGETNGT